VAGAGLATTLSIGLSVCIVAVQFLRGASVVPMTLNLSRARWRIVNEIAHIGFPHFLSMASLSISFMVFNKIVSTIGEAAMNAWMLAGRMDQIVLMPSFCIAGATITIVAQNYGRRNLERIRTVYRRNVALGMSVVAVVALAYALGAPAFFHAFTEVEEVITLASMQVRILAATFVCISAAIISASMFQATRRPILALVVSLTRMGLISIPAALICAFPLRLGFTGVVIGLAIGNVAVLPVALFWASRHLGRLTFRSVEEEKSSRPAIAPVPGLDVT
jgi:Na+-driven multidrug efflux pump